MLVDLEYENGYLVTISVDTTGDEDGTRRIYEELFRFYDGRDTTFPIMRS